MGDGVVPDVGEGQPQKNDNVEHEPDRNIHKREIKHNREDVGSGPEEKQRVKNKT